jgi:hypothetical protein
VGRSVVGVGQGLTARRIYALDGDHLVWHPGEPGSGERPKAFPPSDSHEHLCVVFRREKTFRGPHAAFPERPA